MPETKRYIAKRSNFTIHRPPLFVEEFRQGEPVTVRRHQNPIEFANSTYQTADPDEQEAIETNAAYDERGLEYGDVAPAPSTQELVEAAEEAPSSEEASGGATLQERLENASSQEEVTEILLDEGLPIPGDSAPSSEEEVPDTDKDTPLEDVALQKIEGVSNKDDALAALESIQDTDFDVDTSDKVDEIAAAAEEHGYTFVGWPA